MEVVLLLFDGITALDAVGPCEVLARLPGARVSFVGSTPRVVKAAHASLGLRASAAFADVKRADLLLVPGGPGVRDLLADAELHAWLRDLHATTTWTTSVCTGSLLLGAAGLLRGVRATTHWLAVDELAPFGATVVRDRVVFDGKIATSAGVSAGIDMALELAARIAGPDAAREIQLMLEYDPRPPFNAGSPERATAEIVERVRQRRGRR